MLKSIIFDMDGVLVNSTRNVWDSFNALLNEDGVHLEDDNFRKLLGRSLKDILEEWKKEHPIRDWSVEEFSKRAGNMELNIMRENHEKDQNLHEFIYEAKNKGITIAVATSSMRWRAEEILKILGISHDLDALVTSDDVEKHKPDPEVFLKAAEKLGTHPGDCVVFEDAGSGVKAAKAAKMKVIGIITDFNSDDDLRDADMLIKSFSEVDIERLSSLF